MYHEAQEEERQEEEGRELAPETAAQTLIPVIRGLWSRVYGLGSPHGRYILRQLSVLAQVVAQVCRLLLDLLHEL